jgi:pyridoxal phosphate enzyme (YggS family)
MSSILENFNNLKDRIANACQRCGRDPEEITVIWVSKIQPRERILQALSAGARDLGENRAQEVLEKFPLPVPGDYRLHFIGHLQSNKARKIIPLCQCIQSVDSVKLLHKINAICENLQVQRDIFFQLNTSGETSKSGFEPQNFLEILGQLPPCPYLTYKGLMTIGPLTYDSGAIRASFRKLAALLIEIKAGFSAQNTCFQNLKYLSMGMSDDFEVAIEEGSHYIRIGTSLFGPRLEQTYDKSN